MPTFVYNGKQLINVGDKIPIKLVKVKEEAMTAQEAIDNLRYLISGECCDTQMDYVEEINMAISALEKQMPKEPLNIDEYHPYYGCPSCKQIVSAVQDYCERCGQHIYWRIHT